MVTAAIGAGAGILSSITGGKGAKKAAQQQLKAQQAALAQQQAQFQQTRTDNLPFLQAGQSALGEMGALLGLPGMIGGYGGGTFNVDGSMATPVDPQQAAIDRLKASPGFTSLYDTGADTILQNATATGGLRGGNTNNSLAQFGSGLLAQLIQQQLGNLGGIANLGAGTAGNLGSLGQSNSNAQTLLQGQIGNSKGVIAGSPFASLQGLFSGIGGNIGAGAGGLSGIPGAKW